MNVSCKWVDLSQVSSFHVLRTNLNFVQSGRKSMNFYAKCGVLISEGIAESQQEAQLSPSDRTMRLVSSNHASCHATVQKLLILQVLTKLMV